MRLEITPEPSEPERRAIAKAVTKVTAEADPPRAGWWQVGVEENLQDLLSEQAALDSEPPTVN